MFGLDRLLNEGERLLRKGIQVLAGGVGYSTIRAQLVGMPRILMYHDVCDQGLSERTFDRQLAFLKRRFQVVSLGEFSRRLTEGSLQGTEVVLTFDDGIRNHFTVVYPLLQRHAIAATFFVCPGLIETGEWLWNTDMRERLASLDMASRLSIVHEIGAPCVEVEGVVTWMKSLDPIARMRVAEIVRLGSMGFQGSASSIDRYAPLSWDQVRALDPELITIGSHTMTHPILPTLSMEEAEQEIVGSRNVLEERLDREVSFFCYPNGSFDARTADCVRNTYRLAVTTKPGFVRNGDKPNLLPRIGAGENMAEFKWRLHRP